MVRVWFEFERDFFCTSSFSSCFLRLGVGERVCVCVCVQLCVCVSVNNVCLSSLQDLSVTVCNCMFFILC